MHLKNAGTQDPNFYSRIYSSARTKFAKLDQIFRPAN